jgi:membrane associated rhomboid family serine protease
MLSEQRRVAHGGGMLSQLPPVVRALLILNIGLYFADVLFFDFAIRELGEFSIKGAIFQNKLWEFITFQFIHGSVGHILANSIGLFFFGPFVERWLGSLKFLLYYLSCGVGGAAFFVLLAYIGILPVMSMQSSLVGASAGIYGIIIAVAVIAPHLEVALLFPPITLTMRKLALAVIVIAVGAIAFRIGDNEGGEAGHLGGAIVGFLLINLVPAFRAQTKKGPRRRSRYIEPKIRPRTELDLHTQSEVDLILDKISREGFQSLTDEERDLLQRAAKNEQD